jgi:hypothetical protein
VAAPLDVSVPLRVRVRVGAAGRVAAQRVLGGGAPLTWTLRLPGGRAALPTLRVEAMPLVRQDPLQPPAGATWAAAARSLSGRRMLSVAGASLLQTARTAQYVRFLGAPDPFGSARAVYVYRVVRVPSAAAPGALASSGGGHEQLLLVLVLLAVPVAAVGLAVVWAHA